MTDGTGTPTLELRAEILELRQRLVHAEEAFEKAKKFIVDYASLSNKQSDVTATQLLDMFERIKQLEFKVYPDLSRAIVDVFKITGESDGGEHLDMGAPKRTKPGNTSES